MAGTSIVNPLQALIAATARSVPAVTGTTGRYQARLSSAGQIGLILCDTSSSMGLPAGGRRRRIDHLREALGHVLTPAHRLMAFASAPAWIANAAELPEPDGGTSLHLALDLARPAHPGVTVVISDGEPQSAELALRSAEQLSGVIHTIYCGDESNIEAVEFMRRLALAGCGRSVVHSWVRPTAVPIAATMRLMLAAR